MARETSKAKDDSLRETHQVTALPRLPPKWSGENLALIRGACQGGIPAKVGRILAVGLLADGYVDEDQVEEFAAALECRLLAIWAQETRTE